MTGADVVVIGGGIAGASAAWALVQRGASVVLVEREEQLGLHATGRSAALVNETVGASALRPLVPPSRDFLARPPSGFADHPLLAPRGLLWIGTKIDGPALDALAAGLPSTVAARIGPDEVRRLVPQLRPGWTAAGGFYEPGALTVDVAGLLQAYGRGVKAAGGTILAGLEAVRLQRQAGGWLVHTPTGALRCTTVVDAAGAWGDVIAERAGVRPLGLQPMRRTACLVSVRVDVGGWPLVMDVGERFYAEPEAGGLLLSPADETPSSPGDATADELDVALALDRLNRATDLGVRHVRRAWAGLRTFAADRVPVAGYDPDVAGFYWLVGQGGAGIKTAPALAAITAADITGQAVVGDPAERDGFRPERLR